MKTLYLECNMGAAGDMLTGALLELFPEPGKMVEELNALGIPDVKYVLEPSVKCGITGVHMKVLVHGEEEEVHDHVHGEGAGHTHCHEHEAAEHVHEHEAVHENLAAHGHSHGEEDGQQHVHGEEGHHHEHMHGEGHHHHEHAHDEGGHHHEHIHDEDAHHHNHVHGEGMHHHDHAGHHHTSMQEITHIIDHLHVNEKVKADAKAVYRLIAEAESTVHGQTVEEIHFHEVGSMDAVADVTAVCYLIDKIGAEKILASPVRLGYGHVHCAHGILPVPAPAVAILVKDMLTYGGNLEGEFCTPTGAALLKHFVSAYVQMPVMKIEKTGYGMGKKDFLAANCVRAILGEDEELQEEIIELRCNLDDMTPENIGFVTELLMQEGALDVYTISVQMKKNRPGILLTCMCWQEEKEKFLKLIFKHTTTLGVREYFCRRYGMHRSVETVQTEYGDVRVKHASGYGSERRKAEFEDLARIARETGKSLEEIRGKIFEK